MKQQFLDLTGLTELVAYIKSNVTDKKEILPYASNKLFPSTGDINAIYIDTATNIIYRWDESSKTYKILAQAVKSISISESTENGKITLTVDGVKTTVPIHGLKSAAFTESSAYSPADHTHTKAQIGLGNVNNTADKDKSVKHANTADSATAAGTATTATNVNGENATVDAARHVWFSDSGTETKRNYNDKFKYNPATNTVTANISGSAASANSVLWSGVTNKPSTFTPSAHNHDDSTITSLNASKLFGTIDIARLPQGALERLVIVEDDTARFKLTTANIQLGDTVKVTKTEKMYYVVDESKLSSEAGYAVYTAGTATSVPWSGVTGKPSSYPPASHNHDERYYTETEMNSKLAEKAAKVHTHVKSEVGLGNVDNTADANKSVKYATSAGNASSASSVPWSGVTGKPSTYTPSSHTHKMTDIPDWGSYIYDVHASRTANTVLAAPSGSNGSATFRKLVAADIPTLTKSKISDFPGSLPASDVYAWAKASTKPSYSWGEITGKPGTFTPSGHSHYSLTTIGDQRSTATSPDSYSNNLIFQGLKGNSTIGISNAGNYSYVLGLRGWNDSSGGNSHELAFNNSGIYTRNGATSWNAWKQLLDSSNYTSYTVTKSGSGASGTWGINVSGGAAYPTGFSSRVTSATWGNQTGTLITDWHTSNGGDIQFRDNSGQLNVIIDGFFYQNEGRNLVLDSVNYSNYAATKGHSHGNYMGAISANGFYGMARPDGNTSDWIRTTTNGIIPTQSGSRGSGHSALGTDSWYFNVSYIDHMYSTDVKIADKVLLQYDSTNACLNFVFS